MKYIILALCALTLAGPLAACSNTVHGAGEDIEHAGENLQRKVPAK